MSSAFLLNATIEIYAKVNNAKHHDITRIFIVLPCFNAMVPKTIYRNKAIIFAFIQEFAPGYCEVIMTNAMADSSSKVSLMCGTSFTQRCCSNEEV